jgi:hypothetical protein
MSPVDSSLPDSFAYQRDDSSPGGTIIVAVDITLTQDLMPAGRHLVVHADHVTIASALSLPGKNVSIMARRIDSQNGSIDVSGPAPSTPLARAPDGSGPTGASDGLPGGPGSDGAPGADGTAAGQIWITSAAIEGHLTLIAHGGAGQTGQDGGNGGDGHMGTTGADGIASHMGQQVDQDGQPGNQGGQGGAGGNAGKSGNGGAAGVIKLWTMSVVAQRTVFTAAEPGPPGAPANRGRGGQGGGGGLGGFLMEPSPASFGFGRVIYQLSDRRAGSGPTGPLGRDGNSVNFLGNPDKPVPPAAVAGSSATVAHSIVSASHFIVGHDHVLTQRILTLRQAELSFLNRDWEKAHTLLSWLRDVTPAVGDSNLPSTNGPEWTHVHERAATLLGYLQQALDYFGEPRNHTPILSLNFYRRETPVLLDIGGMIESAYLRYLAEATAQADRLASLNQTIKQTDRHLRTLELDLGNVQRQQTDAQNAIEGLFRAQVTQQLVVMNALDEYRSAVMHSAEGCTFVDFVKGVAHILTMGVEAYQDMTRIASVAASLGDRTSGVVGTIKNVISTTGSVTDLREKFQTVANLNSESHPDRAKLLLTTHDFATRVSSFDTAIDRVIDGTSDSHVADAARNYKTQVHTYLDIVQARNRKAYDYTGLVLQGLRTRSLIDQKTSELTRIRNLAASSIDPMLPALRTFMAGAYHDVRTDLIRYLGHGRQAYNYATLQQTPISLATKNIAALSMSHGDLLRDIENYFNDTNTNPQQRFHNAAAQFDSGGYGPQIAEFKTGRVNSAGQRAHYFGFALPLGHFPNWHQVVANKFTISIPQAKTNNGVLDIDLIHSGRARFRDGNLNTVEYTHRTTLQDYSYNINDGSWSGGGDLGGGEANPESISVSPCTTWMLIVSEAANPGLDLSGVSRIVVTFDGRYYTNNVQGDIRR